MMLRGGIVPKPEFEGQAKERENFGKSLPVGFLFVCMTPAVGSSLLLSPPQKNPNKNEGLLHG